MFLDGTTTRRWLWVPLYPRQNYSSYDKKRNYFIWPTVGSTFSSCLWRWSVRHGDSHKMHQLDPLHETALNAYRHEWVTRFGFFSEEIYAIYFSTEVFIQITGQEKDRSTSNHRITHSFPRLRKWETLFLEFYILKGLVSSNVTTIRARCSSPNYKCWLGFIIQLAFTRFSKLWRRENCQDWPKNHIRSTEWTCHRKLDKRDI